MPPRQAELQPRGVRARVRLPPDVLVRERRGAKQLIPVEARDEVLELARIHAAGERPSDQAAHAGSGGHVDRNPMLLEPADDADVRDAARAAAAERDADGGASDLAQHARSRGLSRCWRRGYGRTSKRGGTGRARQRQKEYHQAASEHH